MFLGGFLVLTKVGLRAVDGNVVRLALLSEPDFEIPHKILPPHQSRLRNASAPETGALWSRVTRGR